MATRTATKNQLLGQLDRSFPGLTLALPDLLATKVGRLVATHFADPKRLTGLGSARFIRFAANANTQLRDGSRWLTPNPRLDATYRQLVRGARGIG